MVDRRTSPRNETSNWPLPVAYPFPVLGSAARYRAIKSGVILKPVQYFVGFTKTQPIGAL